MASLYPGLAHLQTLNHFPMAQFTAAACPPFLDYDNRINLHCRELNVQISKRILDLAPHTVILSAFWLHYYRESDVDRLLGESVKFLRAAGVKQIVVIGPLPLWSPSLPRSIFNQYKQDHSYPPPRYMTRGLSGESAGIEARLQARTRDLGATYVSALAILCGDAGCLSRVGDSWEEIASFDTMHLTVPAAEFLIARIFETHKLGQ